MEREKIITEYNTGEVFSHRNFSRWTIFSYNGLINSIACIHIYILYITGCIYRKILWMLILNAQNFILFTPKYILITSNKIKINQRLVKKNLVDFYSQ